MRHIKPYQIFEASATAPAALTQEQLNWLYKCVKVSWKYNPSTGLVDVDGDFDCSEQNLRDFKGVKFGKVSKDFDCSDNQLTTLEGAPQSVDRDFDCSYNQLTTLEGAPSVDGHFSCHDNQLTTLEGAPQTVDGSFICSDNQLTSLMGAPQIVNGDFLCNDNRLTSLEGAPRSINGGFACEDNPVSETTLEAIFALTKKGKSYQQAVDEFWTEMEDEDRAVLYKEMPSLSPEETRKYNALATYNNIKGYL